MEYVQFFERWGHFLSGITWIGLLYYFNFVQVPAMAILTTPSYSNCTFSSLNAQIDSSILRVNATGAGGFRASGGLYEADAEL